MHRYCLGGSVPQDYGTVHRLAVACGASPEELRTLHRLWAVADAAREPEAMEPEPTETVPTEPMPTEPGPTEPESTKPEATEPIREADDVAGAGGRPAGPVVGPSEPSHEPPEPSHGSGAVGWSGRRIRVGVAVGLAVLFLGGMVWTLPSSGFVPGRQQRRSGRGRR